MTPSRKTSTFLWTAFGVAALAGGISRILEFTHPGTPFTKFCTAAYQPLYLAATAISFHFCRKIASDHRDASTMHMAWLLMAASCAVTIVRHAFEWTTFLLGWHETRITTLVSLRQIPTVLAMVLLTSGLVFMWSAFAAIGLGAKVRKRDVAQAMVIVTLMVAVLSNRQELSDDASVYPLVRYLQWSSPVTLALPALISLVLQRISAEMQGGQFAGALRYLAWSLVFRLASLLTTFAPTLKGKYVLAVAGTAAFWAAPWLFAQAVVLRWRITESIRELTEIYARNPEEEFAKLESPGAPLP